MALAAGHRRDLGVVGLVVDKEWVDKVRGREHRLAHHPTDRIGLAVAARPRALLDQRAAEGVAGEDAVGDGGDLGDRARCNHCRMPRAHRRAHAAGRQRSRREPHEREHLSLSVPGEGRDGPPNGFFSL
eukprot:scaffold34591_cov32-Tisochrysis_lutea.AAC.1